MKDYLYDMENSYEEMHLAKILGISFDDLRRLSYIIDSNQSEDGLVYNYIIEFNTEKSPVEVLSKISRLDDRSTVYLEPWELDLSFDYDEQFDAITENKGFLKKFSEEISDLKKLSELEIIDDNLKLILNRQIFISTIGTMETFLCDAFINLTFDNDVYFKNFVLTHPEFKQRKFELREIFNEYENIRETAKKIILDVIYHNLPTVSQMYQDTFKIDFPRIKDVYQEVLKRHDLVHRNGKTKEGEIVETDTDAIAILINKITDFINEIAVKLNIT